MEPVLRDGDRLLARRTRRPLTRGDVLVIPHPRRADFWLVKRALGLPGEAISIDFGEVLIDDRAGLDAWGQGSTFPEGTWTVGPGEAFVLSDNRAATVDDSRTFGPIATRSTYLVRRIRKV